MPQTTTEQLRNIFGEEAKVASQIENLLCINKPMIPQRDAFVDDRLERLEETNVAECNGFEAAVEEARHAEKMREEHASAAALQARLQQGNQHKENTTAEEDNLTVTIGELEAIKLFAEEERAKVKALRSMMAMFAKIAPISWYEDCSETRAWGVLGEPGALQELDISHTSQFEITTDIWSKMG